MITVCGLRQVTVAFELLFGKVRLTPPALGPGSSLKTTWKSGGESPFDRASVPRKAVTTTGVRPPGTARGGWQPGLSVFQI